MTAPERGSVELLLWPLPRLGEALQALARHAGLTTVAGPPARLPAAVDAAALDRWMAAAGEQLALDVEPVVATNREAPAAIESLYPALIRIGEGALAVLRRKGRSLVCLAADGSLASVTPAQVRTALEAPFAAAHRERIDRLMTRAELPAAVRGRAAAGMLSEFLAQTQVLQGWLLRLPAGASFWRQASHAGLPGLAGSLLAAHAAQYVLFLLAWWTIGRGILGGTLAPGWLLGWALILLTSVPLLMLSTWSQGKLAVVFGMLLRRRLLAGALALPSQMLNREGVGGLLGRTIEADSVERLALSGGFLSALALLELALGAPVLAAGAAGLPHALLMLGWLAIAAVLGVRLARARYAWTDERLRLTGMTVERIVGHRTRLAQELPHRWHDGEDEGLTAYLDRSRHLDHRALVLRVVVPRGWLILGLAALVPAFVAGADPFALGASIGGTVFSWLSFARLGAGIDQLATAFVAWRRVAPLFHAAAGVFPAELAPPRAEVRTSAPEYVIAPPPKNTEPVLEAVELSYRHSNRSTDVLSACNLVVRPGDHILLQGRSGSGKSTFASLLTGMQVPRSGLLLARGLDMSCLGETGWRSRVSASPQFHENHVLSETFAFNILMGRGWPPRPEDIADARKVCQELGLGPLLDRMPGGLYQQVGESGWQLSHGEQSRLFIARALLQNADVVILDESLAALDPENMVTTLRCVRQRARSLIVIAHP